MATRKSRKVAQVNSKANVPAKDDKKPDLVFTPKFKNEAAILAECDNILKTDKALGDSLHAVIISAIAVDEACRATGGAVHTTLTKMYNKLQQSTSIDVAAVLRYLQAIYSDKLTYNKEKRILRAKDLTFRPLIANKQPNGEIVEFHYSELPFWKYHVNVTIRNEPWSFIAMIEKALKRFETPEKLATLGKKGDNAIPAQTERDVAIAIREVLGLMKPATDKPDVRKDMVKEITVLASMAKDNPQVLHDAATRH